MTREGQTFVPKTDYFMEWYRTFCDSDRAADAPRTYTFSIGDDSDNQVTVDSFIIEKIRLVRDMMQEILDFDAMISAKGGAR